MTPKIIIYFWAYLTISDTIYLRLWVNHLISVPPSATTGLIARESEKRAADCEYIKNLLFKRFTIGAEKLRQWTSDESGKYLIFFLIQIKNLSGVLSKEMLVDCMKRQVPAEIREHFLGK